MRIAIIGSPWIPVPPPGYGGTEAVLQGLVEGLAAEGHEVAYAGHPDSAVPGESFDGLNAEHVGPIGHTASELAHVVLAYERAAAWGADVIHDHTLVGPLLRSRSAPVVVTSHGPFDALTTPIFRLAAKRCLLVAISRAQAASAPAVPIAAVVHHGLDIDAWPFGGGGDYLLFLGRMNPDKGAHRAIALAREAGVPLVLAAKMREDAERAYFDREVRPLLHDGACFVGEADTPSKQRLLAGARALLNPIDWPEPFGMVMIEALACGTPVISTPCGAAPEIVEHGRTGFLASAPAQVLEAVDAVGRLDRAACRASVAERFNVARMVQGYVDVYHRAISGSAPRQLPLSVAMT
jgi:glycosyltransferase involved in cell wall biosynthesis